MPASVKNSSESCVDAVNRVSTKSSSLMPMPILPLPPRRWARYSDDRVALDVAGVGDRDDDFFLGDQVFETDLGLFLHDLRAAVVLVFFTELGQLIFDDRTAPALRSPAPT